MCIMKIIIIRSIMIIICFGIYVLGFSVGQDNVSTDDTPTPEATVVLITDTTTSAPDLVEPTLTHTATIVTTSTLILSPTSIVIPTSTPSFTEAPPSTSVSKLTPTLTESPTLTLTLTAAPTLQSVSASEPETTPEVISIIEESLPLLTDTPESIPSTAVSSPIVEGTLSILAPTGTLTHTPVPTDDASVVLPYSSNMNNGAEEWIAEEGWILDASADDPYNLIWVITNDTNQASLKLGSRLDLSGVTSPHMTIYTIMTDVVATPIIEITTDGINWIPVLQIPITTDWTTIDVDLSAYNDETLLLRFSWLSQLSSSDEDPLTFWLIDNVRVMDLEITEPDTSATATPSNITINPVCDADLNLDGILTTEDLLMISKLDEYGTTIEADSQHQLLDINGDDVLNILDLQGLTRLLGYFCEYDT